MSWNYRVMRHVDRIGDRQVTWFGLHETYYTDGKPTAWAKDPECGGFDSVEDLEKSLEMMLNDVRRSKGDVLDYPNDDVPVTPRP